MFIHYYPKNLFPQWKENDKVEYNLIRETEEDERHIEMEISDCISWADQFDFLDHRRQQENYIGANN